MLISGIHGGFDTENTPLLLPPPVQSELLRLVDVQPLSKTKTMHVGKESVKRQFDADEEQGGILR